ncbi:MAG: outer rane lipoprotein carrier protein [Acidobacteriota bacterium]|jgi:outer membrane lipoprotein carrier protein|nr:outer rane lipoprotein carrier protein [Acidobacteriota bacterium]
MKKAVLFLIASAFITHHSSLITSFAQRSELDTLINKIEARYGRMRGLAAEFEQTYNAPGTRERREHGRLVLQRPRLMRWEYDPKPGKLFIVNGRDVWFYVPADREAIHADVNNVSDARFPFLFLLGQTNLRREFRSITLVETSEQSETRTLRLVPRNASSGLREIFLEVYPDGRIVKVKMLDEAGATSEVALTNVRENFIAPADAFAFRPPPGVTVRTQR